MKKSVLQMLPAVLIVSTAGLAGCGTTTTETALRNADGQSRYCYLANDHTLISMGAMSEYNKCLNEAGAAGFKRIEK
jgi:hypothetical protein